MTCIVGIKANGTVWMGGDSAASTSYDSYLLARPKVFRVGKFLMGITGTGRLNQLVRYAFVPPPVPFAKPLDAYLATDFADALRACLKAGGYAGTQNPESYYGQVLVGHAGRLFSVESNYNIFEVADEYLAVGSGEEHAHGALYATAGWPPEQRIRIALEAAAYHGQFVRPPFTIECLDPVRNEEAELPPALAEAA